jgi:hypothetical protein
MLLRLALVTAALATAGCGAAIDDENGTPVSDSGPTGPVADAGTLDLLNSRDRNRRLTASG